jgi:insecticidal toxin complex protein TccC
MTSFALHDSCTPTLAGVDSRGLTVRTVTYCRQRAEQTADTRITRQRFNAVGLLVAHWDPRLWNNTPKPNLATTHGLSGQALLNDSADAGWQLVLLNEAQSPSFNRDARGTTIQTEYDDLQRPIAICEQMADEPPFFTERFIYGPASIGTAAHNQCGRLVRHDDPAGTLELTEYAATETSLVENRRFLKSLDTPDWPLDIPQRNALLEDGVGFTSSQRNFASGERLHQTDAKGNRRTFAYTVAGELKEAWLQLADANEPMQLLVSAIRYNANRKVECETAGNGVVTSLSYGADDGRPIRLSSGIPASSFLQDLQYQYDPVGNILQFEDKAQSVRHFKNQRIDPINRYRYNSLYQLVEARGRQVNAPSYGPELPILLPSPLDPDQLVNYTQTFNYDSAGNLLSRHHSGATTFCMKISDTSNRSLAQREDGSLPDEQDISNGFDARGNQRQLQRGQQMHWDGRQQLSLVTMVKRDDGPDDLERYIYGRRGQRLRKVRIAQTGSRTLISEVRYFNGLEIHFDNASGEERHVISAEAGHNRVRVLQWHTAPPKDVLNNQLRFSLCDLLGSCALELDEEARLLSQEGYFAFAGTAWWAGRSALESKYKTLRYSGKERDASGLYYYGYRYYAPWLQRWMCPDPAGNVDGLNRYLMVQNNPVGFFDEDGLGRTPIEERNSESKFSYLDPDLQKHLYLRDDNSKNRLNQAEHQLIHTLKPKHEIQSVAKYNPSVLRHDSFTNLYEPHTWTFLDNFRNSTNPDGSKKINYFASDVTIHQYNLVSKNEGFFGHLPSIIRRWSVDNFETRQLTRGLESGSEKLLTVFMEKTQNGKSTQQILDIFGLKVVKIEQANNTFDVHVEPISDEYAEYSYSTNKNSKPGVNTPSTKAVKRLQIYPRPIAVEKFSINALSLL